MAVLRTTGTNVTLTDIIGAREFADGGATSALTLSDGFTIENGAVANLTVGPTALAKKQNTQHENDTKHVMQELRQVTLQQNARLQGNVVNLAFALEKDENSIKMELFQINGKLVFSKNLLLKGRNKLPERPHCL
jgi:hypothetical protein